MKRKDSNLFSFFLTFSVLAVVFAVSCNFLKTAYALGSSWSTPCGFGNYRGTSYLSSPCGSSYNCCLEKATRNIVKPAKVVKPVAVKKPVKIVKKPAAPKKPISTYNISDHDLYFAFNSSLLTSKDISILKRDAEYLKNYPSMSVQVQGNCDPRGLTQYNMVLSLKRANAAKSYLEKLGISGNRLHTEAFGKSRPVCHVKSAYCYHLDRSVHFVAINR